MRRNGKSATIAILLSVAAAMAGQLVAPHDALADGDALKPIIFYGFDTSSSMNASFGQTNEYNTRFTRAIQELSGTVKQSGSLTNVLYPDEYNGINVYASYIRMPRKFLICSGGKCDYKTRYVCGSSYNLGSVCDDKLSMNYSWTYMRNLGKDVFKSNEVSKFEDLYNKDGIFHRYLKTVKFGFVAMAGFSTSTTGVGGTVQFPGDDSNVSYGPFLKSASNYSIWNNGNLAQTPTLFPTPADDDDTVTANNQMIITNVRSYWQSANCTPLAGMIDEVGYIYGKSATNHEPYTGIKKQPKLGSYSGSGNISYNEDTQWSCRKKAFIVMTDGAPCGSYVYTDIGKASYDLYELGIEVYPVAYAQSNLSKNSYSDCWTSSNTFSQSGCGVDGTMNAIAWKGGTCREYGHTGKLILPTDVKGYKDYLTEYVGGNSKYTPCYYNALDGNALRNAMTSIVNQLLGGYVSKSKMVTTNAVGKQTTFDGEKSTNGWYNVYSGYKVNFGKIHETTIQREAFVCRDGEFKFDEALSKDENGGDLTYKLNRRLVGSNGCSEKGVCLDKRVIFVGDYTSDRNAVKPGIVGIKDAKAGVMVAPTAKTHQDATKEYSFFTQSYDSTGPRRDIKNISELSLQVGNNDAHRYIRAPYECSVDGDCFSVDNRKCLDWAAQECENEKDVASCKETKMNSCLINSTICDMGQCIVNKETNANQCSGACKVNGVDGFCMDGVCRAPAVPDPKSTHEKCLTSNRVNHLGECVPGVLMDGDIREFLASLPVGTIDYASPAAVNPPSFAYRGAEYAQFKSSYGDRDTMLYVPANDGMLHAFILGKNNTGTSANDSSISYNYKEIVPGVTPNFTDETPSGMEGEEVWAFIPKAMMKKVHELPSFEGERMINGTPVVSDVKMPIIKDGEVTYEWRTILVGGFRDGGVGYYALDVTNPASPEIIWELDNIWKPKQATEKDPGMFDYDQSGISRDLEIKLNGDNVDDQDVDYPFIRMGYSYPEPVITNILIDDVVEPVAIISGGRSVSGTVSENDVTGKAIYIVRLRAENTSSSKKQILVWKYNFDVPITGTPSVFPAGFNSIARLIYIGDNNGALHRIDISSPDISKWVVDNDLGVPIFDPNGIKALNPEAPSEYDANYHAAYERMTYKPAVNALTTAGYPDIQIAFGSGDSSDKNISTSALNYAAVMADFYDTKTQQYHLNNIRPNADTAGVRNLDPLVIVFNPSKGIVSTEGDLKSFDTPSGKQKFEIVAGQESPIKPEPPDDKTDDDDDTKDDPNCASGCTSAFSQCKQDCGNNNSSCYQTCNTKLQACYNECAGENSKPDFGFKECEKLCEEDYNYWKDQCDGYTGEYYSKCMEWVNLFKSKAMNGSAPGGNTCYNICHSNDLNNTCNECRTKLEDCQNNYCTNTNSERGSNAVAEILDYFGMSNDIKLDPIQNQSDWPRCHSNNFCYDWKYSWCPTSDCVAAGYPIEKPSTGISAPEAVPTQRSAKRSAKRDTGNDTYTLKINDGQKMMGAPLTYNFRTYFPTYNAPDVTDDQSACNSGFASIWYADRAKTAKRWGTKSSSSVQNAANLAQAEGAEASSGHASVFTHLVFRNGGFINLGPGTMVYGLSMTNQNICHVKGSNKVSVAAPMLVAQTGGKAGVKGVNSNSGDSNSTYKGSSIDPGQSTGLQIMSINEEAIQPTVEKLSWASVYE